MIYDRTEESVKKAIEIRENKVKSGQELSAEDIAILERGFITIDTISRIEGKQDELKSVFSEMGYYNVPIVHKLWGEGGYFLKSDLERIVKNNKVLKNAYYVFATTPTDATPRTYFEDLNKIEKMLYDLERMVDDMKSRFKRCGTFNCGG
jgi:hypothetical protein